jgi:hypothetical protein
MQACQGTTAGAVTYTYTYMHEHTYTCALSVWQLSALIKRAAHSARLPSQDHGRHNPRRHPRQQHREDGGHDDSSLSRACSADNMPTFDRDPALHCSSKLLSDAAPLHTVSAGGLPQLLTGSIVPLSIGTPIPMHGKHQHNSVTFAPMGMGSPSSATATASVGSYNSPLHANSISRLQ